MIQAGFNALALGSIYSLFALGMSLVWGTTGVLNFAHGSIFMFAAFANYLLLDSVRLPLIALLLFGLIVGATLSVAVQVFAFRPIQRRNKKRETAELQLLVCGLGLAGILIGIVNVKTLGNPFGLNKSSFITQGFTFAGARMTNIKLIVIALGLGLSAIAAIWVRKSRNGLALRAIGVDSETAAIMGVNESALGLGAMAIAGGLAGVGGTLLTFSFGGFQAESGGTLLLKAFAAIILGGVGSMLGTLIGCFFLAIAETVLIINTNGLWVDAVSFGLLFLVLVVRPQGFLGRREISRT